MKREAARWSSLLLWASASDFFFRASRNPHLRRSFFSRIWTLLEVLSAFMGHQKWSQQNSPATRESPRVCTHFASQDHGVPLPYAETAPEDLVHSFEGPGTFPHYPESSLGSPP